MRHHNKNRKLGRKRDGRIALLRSLCNSIIRDGKIKTKEQLFNSLKRKSNVSQEGILSWLNRRKKPPKNRLKRLQKK
jgi:ribosomal protein L17